MRRTCLAFFSLFRFIIYHTLQHTDSPVICLAVQFDCVIVVVQRNQLHLAVLPAVFGLVFLALILFDSVLAAIVEVLFAAFGENDFAIASAGFVPLEHADVAVLNLGLHGIAFGMNSEVAFGVGGEAVARSINPAFLFGHLTTLEVTTGGTEGVERDTYIPFYP